jgi:hypothetical protein
MEAPGEGAANPGADEVVGLNDEQMSRYPHEFSGGRDRGSGSPAPSSSGPG